MSYVQGRQSNQVNQCICTTTFLPRPENSWQKAPVQGKNNPEIPFPALFSPTTFWYRLAPLNKFIARLFQTLWRENKGKSEQLYLQWIANYLMIAWMCVAMYLDSLLAMWRMMF